MQITRDGITYSVWKDACWFTEACIWDYRVSAVIPLTTVKPAVLKLLTHAQGYEETYWTEKIYDLCVNVDVSHNQWYVQNILCLGQQDIVSIYRWKPLGNGIWVRYATDFQNKDDFNLH